MNTDASEKMRVVEIEEEPIELYKILKFENMVQSGGEAKYVIAAELVRVNGEVETRKRKKIVSGDIIEFAEEKIRIITKGSGSRTKAQGTGQKY
jgi:ribosome-associated protein